MTSGVETSVNAEEVARFSKRSEEWWGGRKVLHSLNDIRVPFIKNCLLNLNEVSDSTTESDESLKELNILDVGCGGGFLCEPLAMTGATVTGVEPSTELISVAKRHAASSSHPNVREIRYLDCAVEDHVKDHSAYYDAVVASEVVEHVANPQLFLKSCITALKPGGSIFITAPNKTYLTWFCGIILAEYILKIIPKGTHSYDNFIHLDQLQEMLEENNCKIVHSSGTSYNVFTNSWSLVNFTGFHYAIHAQKSNS